IHDRSKRHEISENMIDTGIDGMRLPDDKSRIDGRAVEIERASRAEAHPGESEVSEDRETGARREEVPLAAERQRDGLRENGRRNSQVFRRCSEAGKIRCE